MTILFVASEVGSVRALLPIIEKCEEHGISYKVIKHGFFHNLKKDFLKNKYIELKDDYIHKKDFRFIDKEKVTKVIFSVNIKDKLPLSIARSADKKRIPTIHILDYWHMYQSRLNIDGLKTFSPSAYIVPDSFAVEEAIKEGVQELSIHNLGHPVFSNLIEEYDDFSKNPSDYVKNVLNRSRGRNLILFISEPVSDDQDDLRGYTEEDAIRILGNSLSDISSNQNHYLCVMPHPREDTEKLKKIWNANKKLVTGHVETNATSAELLPFAKGVIGMSSTFLYQSWLVNTPVLSIRPNDKYTSGEHIKYRQGVKSILHPDEASEKLNKWILELDTIDRNKLYREDLMHHRNSDQRVIDFVQNLEI